MKRARGEAYEGKGYGTQRYRLFKNARARIEISIAAGYYCEAIAIIESVISDRLESRVSHLKGENFGFKNLGPLLKEAEKLETDQDMRVLVEKIDTWRQERNKALHELVKVERDKPQVSWDDRMKAMKQTAIDGYMLLKQIYNRVADLNPLHTDRVFDLP